MITEVLLEQVDESVRTPVLFEGFLEPGAQAAQALLVLGKVARTRFWMPPSMVNRLIAESDPVFTADRTTLRAEAFSPCCGVYARLDLPEVGDLGEGCTNVDLSEATRTVLAGVVAQDPLHLTVRGEGIRLRTLDGQNDESVVPLPERWVAGFAEVAAVTAGAVKKAELDKLEARNFLRRLPVAVGRSWAVASGRGLRLTSRSGGDSIPAGGLHRLRVVEPLIRFAKGLTVHTRPDSEVATWVLQLERARLAVTLSPEPSRGFSGEGGWLNALAGGLEAPELVAGRAGHDVVDGTWFPRELPSGNAPANGRLAKARELVAAEAVRMLPDGGYEITRGGSVQRVRLMPAGCTCAWWAKHQETRGPCSHVLAARISAAEA
ncbi:SWIM zinc finger family protein [Amycolatopsis orientalis]|uniref:SWIM zinc finger family protein n=1 Tax=Amycolatopsis orientalis TaxID=31958 RepID=UPI0004298603|nr:SWIM zinc finger family protein [Amycolatopsis orientalis]